MALKQAELYQAAVREFGRALDRLAAGYEVDPVKRHDLRQDIHFQVWRSLEVFDSRCSLKTRVFRVAHNTAVSYVNSERRKNEPFVSLEEIEEVAATDSHEPDIDQQRALQQLSGLIRQLKSLDECPEHRKAEWLSSLHQLATDQLLQILGITGALDGNR